MPGRGGREEDAHAVHILHFEARSLLISPALTENFGIEARVCFRVL